MVELEATQEEGTQWSPAQRAVIERGLEDPATLVLGAPGSGKTRVALGLAVQAQVQLGWRADDVVLIGASRRTATRLRDQLTVAVDSARTQPSARTMPSLAFSILAAQAVALDEPPPTLISGPEQDTILAEILAGKLEDEGAPLPWPAELPMEILGLRGFRGELRDLLMRAAEHGLQPQDLADLGTQHKRKEWRMAAALYGEYLDILTLQQTTPDRGARFDPAVIIDEAADVLAAWDEETPDAPRPQWRMIIVDDYQEATAATARLLHVLQEHGSQIVLLSEPDLATQTHRGAVPALTGMAKGPRGSVLGAFGAQVHSLDQVYRHGPALRELSQRLTGGMPVHGEAQRRRASSVASTGTSVNTALLGSPAQQVAYVSHHLRTQHLVHGVKWGQMAVITRSGAQLEQLRRGLSQSQVPVALLGSDLPLHSEPAVRPLLQLLLLTQPHPAGTYAPLEIDAALELLYSPLFEIDSLGLRRLRRALRRAETAREGLRRTDEILLEHLDGTQPLQLDKPPGYLAQPLRAVRRLAATIAAGRAAAAVPGTDPAQVLWQIWQSTQCAERWRERSLRGGQAGSRADQDLDAVLALFRATEQFTERLPQAPASALVEYLRSQDLPADTLAAQGAGRGTVSLLTAAGAAGGEWEVVVVAGVQDGIWPDLRLRDSLLGAGDLVDAVTGRLSSDDAGKVARQEVFDDERRTFHVAVTRAATDLLVTAVRDDDNQPSVFFDLIPPPGQDPATPVPAPLPLDLRGLVSELRAVISQTGPDADAAARTLSWLTRQDIEIADPRTWYGTLPWSTTQTLADDNPVYISPSRLESIDTCPLRWFLERHGGTGGTKMEQSLGNIIHQLAEEFPTGGLPQMLSRLDELLPSVEYGDNWDGRNSEARARRMVTRLNEYLAKDSGKPLGQEVDFELTGPDYVLRGSIDRIEEIPPTEPGGAAGLRVVDFKSGKHVLTADQAANNPQLGAYQYALGHDALEQFSQGRESRGAALVYMGDDVARDSATVREQPVLDDETWVGDLIEHATTTMRGNTFEARDNPACDFCPVRTSCPIKTVGLQVVPL